MQPEVRQIPSKWMVYRTATCDRTKIGETLTSPTMLPGIYDHIAPYRKGPTPPFARYTAWRDSDCDLQAGVMLDQGVPAKDDIHVEHLPGGPAVVLEFLGRYDQLGEAHEACMAFVAANNLEHNGPCWETYDGPPSPEGIAKTIVTYPVKPT